MTGGSASEGRRATSSRHARWAVFAVATMYFWGLSWFTTPSRIAPIDLCALLGIYLLFSGFLWTTALTGASLGRIVGFAACLPLAGASVWHLREQTMLPAGHLPFLLAVLGSALGYLLLARAFVPRRSPVLGAAAAGGLALAFLLVTSGLYWSSITLRWHLLRHNKIVGTPAYLLLARPVDAIERQVWKDHQIRPGRSDPSPRATAPSTYTGAPNIVFVLIDTLRADSLAAYGGSPELMPNLNRLADQSLVFGDVSANASWTRPSVASFFTGLPQELHGAVDRVHVLPGERFTIAEALGAAGYETAAFVSNFGAVGRDSGFDQGFDSFQHVKDLQAPYARAEVVNRAVADWLARRNRKANPGSSPVFLYIHYLDPHRPYLSGCDDGCPISTAQQALRSYQKQLRYLDSQLEWVIRDLPAQLPGRTMLLVTSDHGEEFGEHAEGGHGHSLYRELLHLPAILHTGGSSGGRVDARLEARDFFDLILRAATDPAFAGGAWGKHRARTVRYASIDATTPGSVHRPYLGRVFMQGIERDGIRLIWSAYGETYELYDLRADPAERVNLARSRRDEVGALAAAMDELFPRWVRKVAMAHSDETLDLLRALGYVN